MSLNNNNNNSPTRLSPFSDYYHDGSHDIDDDDDDLTVGGRRLLLEEAEEGLAQSLLIFLYADLRLLSATGRIHTKFETLCIDSDVEPKTCADGLAATKPPTIVSNNNHDANGNHSPTRSSSRTKNEEDEFYEGMSPAQIMAALILEIRREIEEHKERIPYRSSNVGLKEDFIFLRDTRGGRTFEENMHSLLKAYNDMVRQDRNKDFRGVNAHRHLGAFVDHIEIPNRISEEDEEENDDDDILETPTREQQQHQDDSPSSKRQRQVSDLNMNTSNDDDDENAEEEADEMVFWEGARRALTERRKSYLERRRARQEALRALMHKQRLVLLQGEDAVAHEEFEALGNSLFIEDDRSAHTLSPDQVVALMEKAVESRVYGQLNFLADFFKPGTVSYVMAKSKARIVWLNDWYPIKDLIYALSVDTEKKRVLVVFRGAITQADWHHAYDSEQIQVPNPVTQEYRNRKDKLKVHSGFYRYLFRRRKDTGGTTKYDEIANMVHAYGMRKIGPDYRVYATGFSLGAALATLFGLYASTEERFTQNGPVKLISFGSPMVGGHSFADAFRQQEYEGRLQYARFYNVRDVVSHLPFNVVPSKRGSKYLHVGLTIKVPRKYVFLSQFQTHLPEIYYVKREGILASYWRALRKNALVNTPWPWRIKIVHSLNEHQHRLNRARKATEKHKNHPVNKTLDELYEEYVLSPNKKNKK